MISFFVAGVPAPKGSASAIPGKKLSPAPCSKCGQYKRGRPIVIPDNRKTKPWEQTIAGAALAALQRQERINGPVQVALTFHMPRPRAHYLRAGLRRDAPHYHTNTPDLDKLERAVLDAIRDLLIGDDRFVASLSGSKIYANGGTQESPGGRSGVQIVISEIAESPSVEEPAQIGIEGL